MSGVNLPGSGGGDQDFELNLAPIIDCLVVLITFMLASATFLSIGILDAGISAGGATQSSTAPPSVVVTLDLKKGYQMILRVEGKENSTASFQPVDAPTTKAPNEAPNTVSATNKTWNIKEAADRLRALRLKWTDLSALTIQGDNDLEYQQFVQVMDALRKDIPVVMLGGF